MDYLDVKDNVFESIKHIDEKGVEYWSARELMTVLEYSEWRKFNGVINKAIINCKGSNNKVSDHFVGAAKMVDIGSKTSRAIDDYKLSRYACYLIALNGDPRKEIIALAKTYFAYKTRKQEIMESDYNSLSEDDKRIYNRELTKKHNYSLNQTAKKAGVKNFDKFHNAGYKGLYNGETADDIAKRKGLRYREDILDNMCSEELVDNLFRIVHTDNKIKRENIQGEKESCDAHYQMGKDIRNFILEHGGTAPEELPTPDKSLKELNKNQTHTNELPKTT